MSKKVWKLTKKATQFIYSVCPDEVTAAQLTKKAYVCFNSDQNSVDFKIASLNPGEILECKATLKLWREECCVFVEDEEIDRPWELTAEEIAQIGEDEDEDDEDDSADEHDGILNCVVIVKHGNDGDDETAEEKKDNE
ncbi:MAG TPA: hypothetical protein IAC89_01600 [Candidatus Aphodousia faecalis]|nr:hypothetical protein [Candidatus Aphodousia faecalis]